MQRDKRAVMTSSAMTGCAIVLKTGHRSGYNTTLTSAGGGGNSLSPPESF